MLCLYSSLALAEGEKAHLIPEYPSLLSDDRGLSEKGAGFCTLTTLVTTAVESANNWQC